MSDPSELSIANLFGVTGKRALVTGGTRGIGRMIAEGLLANGGEVIIAARTEDDVATATEELSRLGSCTGVVADLATEDGRAAVVAAVGDGLDILVNNAGIAVPDPVGRATAETSAAMLGLNITVPLLLTQDLLPALRAGASADDPARVVMIGSVDGLRVPVTPLYTYGASKAGLHALTRQLAHGLIGEHVTVNAVAPGMFESAMTERVLSAPGMKERIEGGIPAGRIGSPADAAAAVIYLASRAGAYLTGAVIPVDGGVSTHG